MSENPNKSNIPSRRQFLLKWSATAAAFLLPGQSVRSEMNYAQVIADQLCRVDARKTIGDLMDGVPIVDVHCHIFNASDLAVFDFIDARVAETAEFDDDMVGLIQTLKSLALNKIQKVLKIAVGYDVEMRCLDALLKNRYVFEGDRKLFPRTDAEYNVSALRKQIEGSSADGDYEELEQAITALHQGATAFLSIPTEDRARVQAPALKAFNKAWLPSARDTETNSYGTSAVPTVEAYRDSGTALLEKNLARNQHIAVRRLAWSLTRSRTRNFQHLRQMYGMARRGPQSDKLPKVQLFTPALVDFDYWLNSSNIPGRPSPSKNVRHMQTSVSQQVKLMAKLMKLYPGQLHPFVPFCPWRQADDIYRRKVDDQNTAFGLVKAAIDQGFVGIKLYPPMGFRPSRNAVDGKTDIAIPDHYNSIRLRVGKDQLKEFGVALDEALDELYAYCQSEDVPIMTHTGYSNSGGQDLNQDTTKAEYASPVYWKRVLDKYPKLRLNFAHFAFERTTWRHEIGSLMDAYENVYADVSYFDDLLYGSQCRYAKCLFKNILGQSFLKSREGQSEWLTEDQIRTDPRFETRNCQDDDKLAGIASPQDKGKLDYRRGKKVLAVPNNRWQRLMYGSDWSMLSLQVGAENYLDISASKFLEFCGDAKQLKAYLGGNALSFLGICTRSGVPTKQRARLEKHYATNFGWSDASIKKRFQWYDDLANEIYS